MRASGLADSEVTPHVEDRVAGVLCVVDSVPGAHGRLLVETVRDAEARREIVPIEHLSRVVVQDVIPGRLRHGVGNAKSQALVEVPLAGADQHGRPAVRVQGPLGSARTEQLDVHDAAIAVAKRRRQLVSQTEVHREFRRHLPRVLDVQRQGRRAELDVSDAGGASRLTRPAQQAGCECIARPRQC